MTPYTQVFYPILAAGLAIAVVSSYLAARKSGFLFPGVLLLLGVVALWAGLFVGSELGYRVWQSSPDPPNEAFSDTFPLGALLFGWFLAGVCCGAMFVLFRSFAPGARAARPRRAPGERLSHDEPS